VDEVFFETELRTQISQGDLLQNIPISYWMIGENSAILPSRYELHTVILLSFDCDFDKKDALYCLVAPWVPLTVADSHKSGLAGNIRAGRVHSVFHIPAVTSPSGLHLPEGFIDFRRMERVGKGIIEKASEDQYRVASLSAATRKALRLRLARFFGIGREYGDEAAL
jgi:hypothetical protein